MVHIITIKVGSNTSQVVKVPEACNFVLDFMIFLKQHLKTSNDIAIYITFSPIDCRVYEATEKFEKLLNDAKDAKHVNVLIRKPKAHGLQIKDLTNYGGHHVVYDGASRCISNNANAGDASVELNCGMKITIPAGSFEGTVSIQAIGSTDPQLSGSILDFSTKK